MSVKESFVHRDGSRFEALRLEDHDFAVVAWKTYRKKPVAVDAWHNTTEYPIVISTLEGDILCQPGDWLIRGTRSELYSCKPEPFEDVYEVAPSTDRGC